MHSNVFTKSTFDGKMNLLFISTELLLLLLKRAYAVLTSANVANVRIEIDYRTVGTSSSSFKSAITSVSLSFVWFSKFALADPPVWK